MKLFLVRHGQSEGNIDKSKYFEKHDSEIDITQQGRIDALNAGLKICNILKNIDETRDYPLDNVSYFDLIHSTYKRATESADVLYNTMHSEKFKVQTKIPSPLCIEREWGELRNITYNNLKTKKHFNFYYKPDNGESLCHCYHRAAIFHQWLIANVTFPNVIVMAHGEFNKVYLMHLLGWDVAEFDRWKTQRNGEVWMVENGRISHFTPLTPNPYLK